MTARETGHWRGAVPLAVVLLGIGLLAAERTLLVGAVVPLAYAAYSVLSPPPSMDVDVTRSLPEGPVRPGDPVTVEVAVENWGDAAVPDLRIVDRPPSGLRLEEGSPRLATSLGPGESTTYEYTLRARRGEFEFGDVVLVSRTVSGSLERTDTRTVEGRLNCRVARPEVPLREQTIRYAGRTPTDEGGSGIEFYAVRDYHHEDPINRVDWNRYARTGSLRTIEFREERAASVLVLQDAREASAVHDPRTGLDGRDLGATVATRVAGSLLDRNNVVGGAVMGGDGGFVRPDAGADQRVLLETLFDDGVETIADRPGCADVLAGTPLNRWRLVRVRMESLFDRLDRNVQVVLVTPLEDDGAAAMARQCEARGHGVTVLSPDLTEASSPGSTVAGFQRRERIADLRSDGTRVVDWSLSGPLSAAVERARVGWSG